MNSSDQFLSAMRDRHGVSEEFVSAGRPLVDAIYAEFEGSERAGLLEFAESVFCQQAETERSLARTSRMLTDAAEQLDQMFSELTRLLVTVRRTVVERSVIPPSIAPRWQLN